MRTTLDIPTPIFNQAKAAAALRGQKLKDFIAFALSEAVRKDLPRPKRAVFPLVKNTMGRKVTSANVRAALDELDHWESEDHARSVRH